MRVIARKRLQRRRTQPGKRDQEFSINGVIVPSEKIDQFMKKQITSHGVPSLLSSRACEHSLTRRVRKRVFTIVTATPEGAEIVCWTPRSATPSDGTLALPGPAPSPSPTLRRVLIGDSPNITTRRQQEKASLWRIGFQSFSQPHCHYRNSTLQILSTSINRKNPYLSTIALPPWRGHPQQAVSELVVPDLSDEAFTQLCSFLPSRRLIDRLISLGMQIHRLP